MTIRLAIKTRATERHTKTEIVQIPAKTNYVVIIGVCLVRISVGAGRFLGCKLMLSKCLIKAKRVSNFTVFLTFPKKKEAL